MVGLAIDGLISGLDTSTLIEALLTSVRAPATRIEARRDATTTKLQAIQALNASVLGVRVAGGALSTSGTFRATEATSSNTEIVQATTTEGAAAGTFEVSVQQLARAMQVSSDPNNVFTDADEALGLQGTIRVNNVNITVRDTDTLRDFAARVTNAHAGVSADVIEVRQGQFRLSIRALETGAEGFTLSDVSTNNLLEALRLGADSSSDVVANPEGSHAYGREFSASILEMGQLLNLESNVPNGTIQISNGSGTINVNVDLATQSLEDIELAINNAASAAGSSIAANVENLGAGRYRLDVNSGDGGPVSFTDDGNVLETLGLVETAFLQVDQEGLDSQFRVNGIDVVRTSNTISDVIEGVTFNLISDANPTTTAIVSITSTNEGALEAVQGFINAYNNTKSFIRQVASFDPETQAAGILLGDSSILSVDRELSGVLFRTLSTLPSQLLDNLNGGIGVASGSIQIADRSGATATIDLSGAETVQDVIDRINRNRDVDVEASINSAGTGLVLRDSSGGFGNLTVSEVGGGTNAADLGILGTAQGSALQGTAVAEAEFVSVVQMGIEVNVDGTLSLDTAAFQEFLDENPGAAEAFFTQKGGFADLLSAATDRLTDAETGLLSTQATSLEDMIENFNDSIERIEERVTREEERLRRQFANLEQALAQLQEQSSYIESMFAQLTANSRGN